MQSLEEIIQQNLKNFSLFDASENYIVRDPRVFEKISGDKKTMYCLYEVSLFPHVPITENGESFVVLSNFLKKNNSKILLAPGSTVYGSAKGELLLRERVAEKLLNAEKLIQNYTNGVCSLKITDAYRPLALQREHFKNVKIELREKEGLDAEALYDRALECISDPDLCPPHSTGGTVDLTIYDSMTQRELPMGTLVDEVSNNLVWTWNAGITDPRMQKNRLLLFAAMTSVGFVNCPTEWWHYSYGDQEWALRNKKSSTLFSSI